MSKNLVLKGLSFVRKGQGGKPSSVDTSGKASEGAVSFVASSGGKEGSKTKLKREPHLPKGGSVNHGRISKPAKAKRSSGEKLQKEVAKRHELKRMCIPIPEGPYHKNCYLYVYVRSWFSLRNCVGRP